MHTCVDLTEGTPRLRSYIIWRYWYHVSMEMEHCLCCIATVRCGAGATCEIAHRVTLNVRSESQFSSGVQSRDSSQKKTEKNVGAPRYHTTIVHIATFSIRHSRYVSFA